MEALRHYFGLHRANLVGAIKRLAAQPFASLLTILVIATALALPAGLRVAVNNADAVSNSWHGAADFTVYLKLNVSEEAAQRTAHALEARAEHRLVVALEHHAQLVLRARVPHEHAAATDDPKVAQKGRRLLPLGGSREGGSHKGYGLAVVVEILCGVLTGTVTALNADQDPRGHFFGAIRIDTFRPIDEFKRDMDRLIGELKSTPPIEGQERVYVAGEIEFETAQERAEHGIPLLSSVLKGLREVGEQLGVPYDLE